MRWSKGLLVAVSLLCTLSFSAPVGAAEPASAPVNIEAPKLAGTPIVGQALSCGAGVWRNNPSSFTYAWLRDGAPIGGQAANTYTIGSADLGHSLACRVTASNAAGEYTVGSLSTGSYVVNFESLAGWFSLGPYLFQYYNEKTSSSQADHVSVAVGATTDGVNVTMHRGGQITGTVTGFSKAPVAEVSVCPFEAGSSPDLKNFYGEGCVYTNASGEYTIIGLTSGSYKLLVLPPSLETGTEYVPQFYNLKNTFGEAEAVSVTAGETSTANIGLAPAIFGGAIKGHVASAASGKVSLREVSVCADSELGYPFSECVYTDASGNYFLQGLLPGSYTVEFWASPQSGSYLPQYYNGKATAKEATVLNLESLKEKSGINAELTPAGQISGTVTDASTHAPLANVEVCADNVSTFYGECGETDAAGKYVAADLATGSYKLGFYPYDEAHMAEYFNGRLNASEAEEVHVTAPAAISGINAALPLGGQIAGTVIDAATHTPLAHIDVCAIDPKNSSKCVFTDSNGGYVIRQLMTNTYKVKFSSTSGEGGNYLTQYYEGKSALPEATGVSVTLGGTTAGINAEMRPGGQIHGTILDALTHAPLGDIRVCAYQAEGPVDISCAESISVGASGTATSNALAATVPGSPSAANSSFSSAKPPVFDSKTNDLDFFLSVADAGTLRWSLSFRNADVGFADSLGISRGAGAVAEASRKKGKAKAKKCKKGEIKHHGKCKRVLVPFSSGSKQVAAGTVEIKVHADSAAVKALKSGHTLHVSGPFKFQSSLGGKAVVHNYSAVVHPPRAKHKRGKK